MTLDRVFGHVPTLVRVTPSLMWSCTYYWPLYYFYETLKVTANRMQGHVWARNFKLNEDTILKNQKLRVICGPFYKH